MGSRHLSNRSPAQEGRLSARPGPESPPPGPRARIRRTLSSVLPYAQIARFDHWPKNVFMLPGVLVALLARPDLLSVDTAGRVIFALLTVGIIASSNYVLNELMDREFDAFHPVKKFRPIPSGQVSTKVAAGQWLAFAAVGMAFAWLLGAKFFIAAMSLWIMGCVYNIPPFRTKDKAYLDVLSESVNNPIRLILGWYATGIAALPSVSLVLAYWTAGAFFMAIKRFAEYRTIDNPVVSASYRKSFAYYNEERLLKSIIYYATAFGLFFGVFLIRYRMELILSTPFIAGFMTWYFHMGLLDDSPTQYPERLFRQRGFVAYALLCTAVVLVLLFVPIPYLHEIFKSSFSLS